jgi:hypothetical protein
MNEKNMMNEEEIFKIMDDILNQVDEVDVDENVKLEKKIQILNEHYLHIKSEKRNAYCKMIEYDNIMKSCYQKKCEFEMDLLKIKTTDEILINEPISKEEADIIFYGMDKTDYSGYKQRNIPRFMDLEKIQNKIKEIKEINLGWKLVKLDIGSSQDSLPPINNYIYVFEDTHGIKYRIYS